jgi:S1-C subfamily serine protease
MALSRRTLPALLLLLLLGLFFAPALFAQQTREEPVSPALRNAVVRVEVAIDPTSNGPALMRELAARRSRKPFARELLRRLRMGAVGTGFVISSSGYVVTNAHVILSGVRYRDLRFPEADWESMRRLLVTVRDIWVTVGEGEEQRDYLAEPVLIAEQMDLAVLKIVTPPGQPAAFTPLPIASSGALGVGDAVLSLGFPDGDFQASRGHILSLIHGYQVNEEMQIVEHTDGDTGARTVTVGGTTGGPVTRLQHDAPSGHGSSGGPLLDARGRVIAVAYALLSERDAAGNASLRTDLNLAITSDVLLHLLQQHSIPYQEARP